MDGAMGLGWKVIAGAICLGMGQLFGAAVTDCPVPSWVPWLKWFGTLFNAGGMVLAGIGVSSKVAGAVNTVTKTMQRNQTIMLKGLSDQKFVERVVEKQIPYVVKRLGPLDEIMVRKNITKDVKEVKKE